jgi:hypoxanthine phosphoribosyltransferase|tara:strand:- start:77 stop:463 length:387 start_codon:yes stop_codon:yes gene_type:complete
MYKKTTWKELENDVNSMYEYIRIMSRAVDFKGIWGPPRGGLILAVMLSHRTGLPMISKGRYLSDYKPLIVVDDIADTGKTLEESRKIKDNIIMTLYYHKQSTVIPDYWIHEKKNEWILFPWETVDSTE